MSSFVPTGLRRTRFVDKLPVLEVFGPTLQGEGMVIGRKTMFVRTAGCDYRCIWCDSRFTWDGSERPHWLTPAQVWKELESKGGRRFDYVTLSGGNPALLGDPMAELVRLLHQHGVRVGVETQGSVWQPWLLDVDDVTLSPKPPSSGMQPDLQVLDDLVQRLQSLSTRAQTSLKIVVFDEADLAFARRLHSRYPQLPLVLSVGNDKLSAAADGLTERLLARLRWLAEAVAADEQLRSVRVLPQLHVLLWGNQRGV
ncbi:MAG: 7-carboxy-7-deazaguanine synthase QueE [Alicyclobacillus sp.]|nr:7-carboxy-7-deazaguanine synthase QueE [Alicyclobacillus sp.]